MITCGSCNKGNDGDNNNDSNNVVDAALRLKLRVMVLRFKSVVVVGGNYQVTAAALYSSLT